MSSLKVDSVEEKMLLEEVVSNSELLSRAPLIEGPKRPHDSRPFAGYHQFKVWVPAKGPLKTPVPSNTYMSSNTYHVVNNNGTSRVFIPLGRSWPLVVAFRPSVTPVELIWRITPVFVSGDRAGENVERCKKHVRMDNSLKGRSFLEVVDPSVQYVRYGPSGQITICRAIDLIEWFHGSRNESVNEGSQSTGSQSILLPEVQSTVICRAQCFNSCLGLYHKGEVDLVITLESRVENPSGGIDYKILGLERVNVRCCASPSRDWREFVGMGPDPESLKSDTENVPKRRSRRLSLESSSYRNIRMIPERSEEYPTMSSLKVDSVEEKMLLEEVVSNSELLSRAPLIEGPKRPHDSRRPFAGYHQFKVWVPAKGPLKTPVPSNTYMSSNTYHVVNNNGTSRVFIPLGRSWPLVVAFRPSVTPVELIWRITPVFVSGDRAGENVERCKKHVRMDNSLKGRSFLEVVDPSVQYVRYGPSGQITICRAIDLIEWFHGSRNESVNEGSQSTGSQSILLPEVQSTVICRAQCFNSCLGLYHKGEVDLVITLESRVENPSGGIDYKILGLERVNVRCCASPSRDWREFVGMGPDPESLKSDTENVPKRRSRRLSLESSSYRNIRMSGSSFNEPSTSKSGFHDVVVNGKVYHFVVFEGDTCIPSILGIRNYQTLADNSVPRRDASRALRIIQKNYDLVEECIAQRLRKTKAIHLPRRTIETAI
ncbi:unnamed protein product [Calicophoron daubneyi]|uniref:p53 DNA-binding domain-containing protein n=1 Tax=Calicophoron daubneyi TaxID=300641 RepID=A0AAV2T6P0_CALDB